MKLRTLVLIATLALGLLAAPLPAEAQKPGKVYRIGYLSGLSRSAGERLAQVFLQGLRDLGWVEGQNLIIEWRWAEGRMDRFPDLAADVVRLNVDVILAITTPGTRAAMKATKTIPIVFTLVSDPVGSGFTASLARPGGNVTGLTNIFPELAGKQLELLKEAVPGISRVAVLWDPTNLGLVQIFKQIQVAAPVLGLTIQSLEVQDPNDFEPAFSAMTKERVDALFVTDSLIFTHRHRIADLALTNGLPTMSVLAAYVRAGGFMSYAPSFPAMFRRAAHYVDRILKGAKPADLPVEQPTKFELIINLKTAKALGLTIPDSLLFRADRVIK